MIEPVIDQVCELGLEVWKQGSCCENVEKPCDSGCHCDNDEHYDELVACFFLLHKCCLCLQNCHIKFRDYISHELFLLSLSYLNLAWFPMLVAPSVPRYLHNTFGLKKFSLLNGHKKISRNFYLSGDSFVQSLDFMLFSAFSFLSFKVYSVFFGYHSSPLPPPISPGDGGINKHNYSNLSLSNYL